MSGSAYHNGHVAGFMSYGSYYSMVALITVPTGLKKAGDPQVKVESLNWLKFEDSQTRLKLHSAVKNQSLLKLSYLISWGSRATQMEEEESFTLP